MAELSARRGGPADEDAILGLFDGAVEWMLARGQAGQWGSTPPSQDERWRARVHALVTKSEIQILELDRDPVGVLALGDAPGHVETATEPEIYIELLLTARSHQGRGLGGELLAIAERIAREGSVRVLRVDCWAEAPSLVRWYEDQGFVRCGTFDLQGWRGQVFSRPVPYSSTA